MSLTTKSKTNVHHRKRQASHHKHNRPYLKTYWPYLPMLAIVGLGYAVNNAWRGLSDQTINPDYAAASLTRIEDLTGDQASLSLAIVCVLAAVAFAVFLFAHWRCLHRMLHKGEAYIIHHPWLEIGLVFTFTAGLVLTRTR